ncbi:MAG TPA: hypothetical protein VHR86_06230 [Armatimonadota bacterium]|nr:hypothetical protein [Armatimonadota bacterium]
METQAELYEALLALSRQQAQCVAMDDMARLAQVLAEKDVLLRRLDVRRGIPQKNDAAELARARKAAQALAESEREVVAALQDKLEAVGAQLRQAGCERLALQAYRPGNVSAPLVDRYW